MKTKLLTAITALLLALPASSIAQGDLQLVKSSGVIRVGTEGTYSPFTYHDAKGALTGFDVEIAREIGKRLGVKVEFVEGKWDGLIAGLDVKRYDAVINEVTISDARKAKYDFSEPYIVSKAALIVKSDNNSITSFAGLKGKKSSQSATSNFAKLAQDNGAVIVTSDGFNQSIELLLAGRADATINDNLSFLDFKTHRPDAKVKIAALQDNAEKQAVLVRKGSPDFVAAINKALADIHADGTFLQISKKYFGEDVSK